MKKPHDEIALDTGDRNIHYLDVVGWVQTITPAIQLQSRALRQKQARCDRI